MFIPWSEPDFGKEEKEAAFKIINKGWLTQGAETETFEKELSNYIGCKHVVAVSNGTMALIAGLLAHGIGPGDEVIVPTFTFIATINAVLAVGATPVLADCELDTWNLSPTEAAKHINKKTRAILAVDVAGMPCDIDGFKKLCKLQKIIFIEDGAEAIGAQYKNKEVGSFGNSCIFSFHMAKLITTVEGGCITTNSNSVAKKIRMVRNHGRSNLYKDLKDKNNYSFDAYGLNMRMIDILSAIGRVQLSKIKTSLETRKRLVDLYKQELKSKYEFQKIPPYVTNHANMFFGILCESKIRNKIQKKLFDNQISTRIPFTPVHKQKWHKNNLRFSANDFQNSETIYSRILSLPLGNKITQEQVTKVIGILKKI